MARGHTGQQSGGTEWDPCFGPQACLSIGEISRENKKYWDVPPSECELIPTLREKRTCATREEFDAFVAEYMEE
jgi:hypothetical protein